VLRRRGRRRYAVNRLRRRMKIPSARRLSRKSATRYTVHES
jgi:hypothetical protein